MPQYLGESDMDYLYQHDDGSPFSVPKGVFNGLLGVASPQATASEVQPPWQAYMPQQEASPPPLPVPQIGPAVTAPQPFSIVPPSPESLTAVNQSIALPAQPPAASMPMSKKMSRGDAMDQMATQKAEQGFTAATQQQVAGAAQAAQGEAAKAQYESEQGSKIAADAQNQLNQQQINLDSIQQKAQNTVDQVMKGNEELSKVKQDPGRLFKNMDTGQRFAAAISLFIGGMLEQKTGKNTALQIIQNAIDRDVTAQVADLQNRRESLRMRSSMMMDYLRQGLDINQAKTAVGVHQLEIAKQQVIAEAGKYQSPVIMGKFNEFLGGLQEKLTGAANSLYQQTVQNQLNRGQLGVAQMNATTERGKLGIELTKAEQMGKAAQAKAQQEQDKVTVKSPDGRVLGVAGSDEIANKGREAVAQWAATDSQLQKAIELTKQGRSFEGVNGKLASARYKEAQTVFASLIREAAHGMGRFSEHEIGILKQIYGEPKGLWTADALPKLQMAQQLHDQGVQARLSGLLGGQVQLVQPPPTGFKSGAQSPEQYNGRASAGLPPIKPVELTPAGSPFKDPALYEYLKQ